MNTFPAYQESGLYMRAKRHGFHLQIHAYLGYGRASHQSWLPVLRKKYVLLIIKDVNTCLVGWIGRSEELRSGVNQYLDV